MEKKATGISRGWSIVGIATFIGETRRRRDKNNGSRAARAERAWRAGLPNEIFMFRRRRRLPTPGSLAAFFLLCTSTHYRASIRKPRGIGDGMIEEETPLSRLD